MAVEVVFVFGFEGDFEADEGCGVGYEVGEAMEAVSDEGLGVG